MDAEEETTPYSVNLHQEDASKLVTSSAFLLILNMPPGSSFGLDMQMFVVGPNFKGVKMLLPGPHFVYYSARSRHGGDSSPVTGYFVHASPSKVFVREWDTQEECLVKLRDSNEEERYELAARNMEFDRHLAPYDLAHYKTWQLLTNFISVDVIGRIEPVGGDISVMAEAAVVENSLKTPAERHLYEQISKGKEQQQPSISSMSLEESDHREGNVNVLGESKAVDFQEDNRSSGRCFYTHLPHLVKQAGMTPSELTALNMDKSQVLELLLEREYQGQEDLLLGELQFCFIAFLMGQSLESFGQWKGIVSLLLKCEEAPLQTRTKLCVKFLGVIYWQLKQSLKPDAKSNSRSTDNMPLLDDTWLSQDNFFKLLLKDFFNMLKDATPVDGELLRQTNRLKKLVEETLRWIFGTDNVVDEEDDEYAPVVVYEEDMMMGNATEV